MSRPRHTETYTIWKQRTLSKYLRSRRQPPREALLKHIYDVAGDSHDVHPKLHESVVIPGFDDRGHVTDILTDNVVVVRLLSVELKFHVTRNGKQLTALRPIQ